MRPGTIGLCLLMLAWTGPGARLGAQVPDPAADDDDKGPGGRYKVLSGPDALDKMDKMEKSAKEKLRPPLEFFRSQVAPFDVLPFAKARHWSTVNLEMRANYGDYGGLLATEPVRMEGMPHDVVFRREARLLKGQQTRLGMQAMLPVVPKELVLELMRPDAIRPDEALPASLRVLEPHQMLIVFLARNPNDFAHWTKMHALLPSSGDRDPQATEKQRYYRLVIPQDPDKPLVSPHPLTWTTISHVIWDGFDPESLNTAQQQALLDWLHWGGQLVITGGAAPSFAALQDSFLGPYLPADPAGENTMMEAADLAPLAADYRPPQWPEENELVLGNDNGPRPPPIRYKEPVAIQPAPKRPVFFAGLRPREEAGAIGLPVGDRADRLLGVERRVGRGRVMMLSFSPNDPALASWPGLDTLVRRLILRRPEEGAFYGRGRRPLAGGRSTPNPGQASNEWQFPCLAGTELSWVRYVGRDLGSTASPSPRVNDTFEPELPRAPVAEWSDAARLPFLSRQVLKEASGITIPGTAFILKVIFAYIIALVPVNWLVCRFVLRRREWAWAVVPVLALGFAIGVERAAAYDLGFDSGCDEIDVLETFGNYSRGHLSRFAALFSTGRVRYTISYPADPTALALPMATGDEMRGEKIGQTIWQSLPVPALTGLMVQPRSLALFHAEQMTALPGTIDLVTDTGPRRIVNGSGLELHDAVLIEDGGERRTELGTIAAGATVALGGEPPPRPSKDAAAWIDPEPFLKPLTSYNWNNLEDQGEIRLVGWAPKLLPGQKLDPEVDRHRGMTLVIAHLQMGPPPGPDASRYDSLAPTAEAPQARAEPAERPVLKRVSRVQESRGPMPRKATRPVAGQETSPP